MQENKMGVMPVNKLLLGMSVPMMFSMLVQALYNIVDSIFVARIGEDALTAVSLAFPLQSLMIALAGGTCVGLNAVLSKALGEKNFEKVNKSATNAIFLMILNIMEVKQEYGILRKRDRQATRRTETASHEEVTSSKQKMSHLVPPEER